MINRRTLKCRGCDSKIITRTQVGHRDSQTHSFACPHCGVKLSFTMDLNQKKVTLSYRQPLNGDWVDDEEGALTAMMFSDDIPVPVSREHFSPFSATVWNFKDREEYTRAEQLRQQFTRVDFDYIERCVTHFERNDWKLFDKESPPSGESEATPRGRLINLYNAIQGGFSNFTLTSRSERDRIQQRFHFARSRRPDLVQELAELYVSNGRMSKLWKELSVVRRAFVDNYNSGLQPLLQIPYWREECRDLTHFELSIKQFDRLRQLYIDTFETLCRLLVIATAVEAIIQNDSLAVRLSKRSASLEEFEGFANATKRNFFVKLVIGDLFSDVLDLKLRNGIGHHSAHYEADTDEVVVYDTKQGATVERRIRYTDFCHGVLQLFAAFELAAMYHHALHIQADGRLA